MLYLDLFLSLNPRKERISLSFFIIAPLIFEHVLTSAEIIPTPIVNYWAQLIGRQYIVRKHIKKL